MLTLREKVVSFALLAKGGGTDESMLYDASTHNKRDDRQELSRKPSL